MNQTCTQRGSPPGSARRTHFILGAMLATILVGGASQKALAHESSSQPAIEVTR